MHSIRTKITAMTVCVIVIAMTVAAVLGVGALKDLGSRNADQTLLVLCQKGQRDLNLYFDSVEHSVETISTFAESDLDGLEDDKLEAHLQRVGDMFRKKAEGMSGVLTYYYRIDPEVSDSVRGFWYVNLDGKGFKEHEVTDLSEYDTEDTSSLVWFTVPKTTLKGVWLPPYITENLNARVLSYNLPVRFEGKFVGVIGIELDHSVMAEEVNNITLCDNGYAFINDADGNLIYHPRMDVAAMEKKPDAPSGVTDAEEFYRYTYEGVEKQAVWLPLSNGMHLNVTVPVEEINADWRRWSAQIAVTFAALLLVFIILIMAFVGRITNPLRKLTRAAEQIMRGEYDCDLTYDRKDEIGILTNTFRKVISNLKTYISSLNEMACIDALTGLKNRLALRRDYDSYTGHEVSVMMIDLNDFKVINDTYGHEEGDRVLKETGSLLMDTFGEECCYRYGGDEFLVIVPDIPAEEFRGKVDLMDEKRPLIEDGSAAGLSAGYVRAAVKDSDVLRTLISAADEKMYEKKRDKKRAPVMSGEMREPLMKATEYTVGELRAFVGEMSEKYALARVVDPIECRIIELHDNGTISMNESCYGIWNAEQKCINCSSAMACRTGCHQEKAEHFQDNFYFIQSNPVKLKLANGSTYDAVVELVNVEQEVAGKINNRESENVGARADHYRAHHDSLTNVLNADAFYELSRDLLTGSGSTSWVMITGNIMNFRLINTLFGDQKGNEVLVRTGSLLKEISEGARGLCGRLGGDQFALLIPKKKYKEESLLSVARVLAAVYNTGIYTFYIHFGVYEIDDPSIPVSVMCGRANSALRTIREDMTQVVAYFNELILEKVLLEQTVLGSFEEALRGGQFKMYLQPLFKGDGTVTGAEALVRWVRPDGSMLMPGDFIETLETAGLIHKLDRYMWELAAKKLKEWKMSGTSGLTISVNVSAKDFYNIDVASVLTELVRAHGVDSRMLRLEITETALLGNIDQCESIVSELRRDGFLVEIDDFGKDNSSLGLLKDISADILKLDMSLVREISDKERTRVILNSLIAMADSLGMDVISEGVETEQQLSALTGMGCSHFQGYYFSRPLPVREFEEKYVRSDV